VRGYLELARAQGLDVEAVVNAAGAAGYLENIDGRVPWQACERLALDIVQRIGPAGMVRTMQKLRGAGFSILYYAARYSDTVGLALRRVAEHYHLTSTLATCELVESSNDARLTLTQREHLSSKFKGLISVLWAVSNVTVLRQLVGADFCPVEVRLELPRPSDPDELGAYTEALRSPLRFDAPVSAIEIERTLLDEKVVGADPVLEAAMMRYVSELTARLPDEGLAGRVRRVLVESLRAGEPGVGTVARTLGTTSRTLQRRLRDEGTSFQQVLDEVRREVAVTHMRGRRATIDEIAFLLGFEKPSSFHRAFKRWTGITPGEFRRQLAAG
jgi:AraC-like DNA-binding protein